MKLSREVEELQKEKLELLEAKLFLKNNLPFLPGPKGKGCNLHGLYNWQEDAIKSTARMNFLTASNQSGKSVALIIRCLRWAYFKHLWGKLWDHEPKLFVYLYPDKDTATREFRSKWLKYLPSKELKKDPVWGYQEYFDDKGKIHSIKFNSGIWLYFWSYQQSETHQQASTVDAAFADEELPESHFSELQMRVKNGYFHNFFTATLGQLYLFQTMECVGQTDEKFPFAWKRQISMFDCLVYSDGRKSLHITEESIKETIQSLPNENEVLKRVYGRFVSADGVRFSSFTYKLNVVEPHYVPKTWYIYVGVDYGSGGHNHPSAFVFVAVDPSFVKARVIKSWRGDKEVTTQGDVINKYKEMAKGFNIMQVKYDYSAADLGILAERLGLPFTRANKSHDGIATINTLLKNLQLKVFSDQVEVIEELQTVQNKRNAGSDDVSDALRYAIADVPFVINTVEDVEDNKIKILDDDPYKEMDERERFHKGLDRYAGFDRDQSLEMELEEVAEMFDVEGFS